MKLGIAMSTALLGLLASSAVIAEPQPGDIRITDPDELIEMGFDPIHDEVWRAANTGANPTPDARLAKREPNSSNAPNAILNYRRADVQGTDFHFRGQSATFVHNDNFSLYCTIGSPVRHADASIELLNGSSLDYIAVWTVDNSTTAGVETALYEVCERNISPPSRTVVQIANFGTGINEAPGAGFELVDLDAGPEYRWVKSAQCAYMVRATFSACANSKVRLQKVRVEWNE